MISKVSADGAWEKCGKCDVMFSVNSSKSTLENHLRTHDIFLEDDVRQQRFAFYGTLVASAPLPVTCGRNANNDGDLSL